METTIIKAGLRSLPTARRKSAWLASYPRFAFLHFGIEQHSRSMPKFFKVAGQRKGEPFRTSMGQARSKFSILDLGFAIGKSKSFHQTGLYAVIRYADCPAASGDADGDVRARSLLRSFGS